MHNGVAIRLVLIYDLVVVAANNLTGDTNMSKYDKYGSDLNKLVPEFDPIPLLLIAVIVLGLALVSSIDNCGV